VVGLQPGVVTDDSVVFGDQTTPALAIGTHSEAPGRTQEPARHRIGLITTGIQADAARLRAAGVRFVEEPNNHGGGFWLATFEDPEGNLIQLYEMDADS
jgi:predicted enzyme related to lactoylglutathione lyase